MVIFIVTYVINQLKLHWKKKDLISQYHKSSTKSIFHKYTVKNPSFLHIEDILKNFVDDYNKKFAFFIIFCKWQLHFSDTIINIKSDRLYNIKRKYASWNLRRNLTSKFEYFESIGHKFSHISEMDIVFMTDLRNMTYEHYLKKPKPIIEWTIIKKLAKNRSLYKHLI